MKTIHKYTLAITDKQTIQMPVGAGILTVQNQNESLCMWAQVDDQPHRVESRAFAVIGTGHEMREYNSLGYLGTVQFQGGALVFHVFEIDPMPF
jgi:hypothetical protein